MATEAVSDRKAKTAALFAEMKAKSFPEARVAAAASEHAHTHTPAACWRRRRAQALMRLCLALSLARRVENLPQVPDLTAAEVRAAVDGDAGAGRVVLVDCRSAEEQAVSTIPSARTLPQQQLEAARAAGGLEPPTRLICFCTIGYRRDWHTPPRGPRASRRQAPRHVQSSNIILLTLLRPRQTAAGPAWRRAACGRRGSTPSTSAAPC
jgi:rhodanese-related sulfurtransferase